jgi:hypothetical protein
MRPVTLYLDLSEEIDPPLQRRIDDMLITSIGLCLDLGAADRTVCSADV